MKYGHYALFFTALTHVICLYNFD